MTIKEILEEKLKYVFGEGEIFKAYLAPNIPDKKLRNAAKVLAGGIPESEILAICDTTLFGSAKDGLAFTENEVYTRMMFDSTRKKISYDTIKKVEVKAIDGKNTIIVYDNNDNILYSEDTCYQLEPLKEVLIALAGLNVGTNAGDELKADSEQSGTNKKNEEGVEENEASISLDYTMNQHCLPLQTEADKFDSFMGLEFGSKLFENLFQLRCLGWTEIELYHEKKAFSKESCATVFFQNPDCSVSNCKIKYLILTYTLITVDNATLTRIRICFEEKSEAKKLTAFAEQTFKAKLPLHYAVSSGETNAGNQYIEFFKEGTKEAISEKNIKNILRFFYENKGMNPIINSSSFVLPVFYSFCQNPRGNIGVDFSNSESRNPVVMLIASASYIFEDNEAYAFAGTFLEKKNKDRNAKRIQSISNKLIAYFDAPRDSYDKADAITKVKAILQETEENEKKKAAKEAAKKASLNEKERKFQALIDSLADL